MASVSWTYPYDELIALQRRNERAADETGTIDAGLGHQNLRFRYAISGNDPSQRPLGAFDDGRKIYIQFPSGLFQSEAPPFFVVVPKGDNELVNHRVNGNFFIVDRLFPAADLRLGEDPQQVIRISRTDGQKHGS